MASRTFTVFQDVPTTEVIKAKPVTSNVMTTRSSARLNNILQGSSVLTELAPIDKENVNPVTGERAGASAASKKRKTNVLATKSAAPLAVKKAKSSKEAKDPQPESKKRKASSETTKSKSKSSAKKDGKVSGSSRKSTAKRVTRKVSKLPCLEEEADTKGQEAERLVQATIDSRCYELTVQPLADVSQAYEVVEHAQDPSPSPASKAKFRKNASAEPEIQDLFSSSGTLASLSSSTVRAPSADPVESRKFSTPERKQIYAAFTFSSPSPTSERFKSSSRSGSARLELA
ncbi:hypothetical protein P691DRAFT_727290 [Macrolepiota fuliginosa MF-IS2]|uniref:Uncharacterized protein n=1 Tax=Macrolepiota fuliginosa MF-IS2 TaxID=1400762 RepID=A0A9P5XHU9_9AGAR|nr:hypothetical protein P691DRAFT_727290 [Macrolepiota fuliginosa MF-IS2]